MQFGLLLLLLVSVSSGFSAQAISLAGQWRFQLDRTDAGVSERWFERGLPDKIDLPGSLPAQGVGDAVTTNTSWTGTIVDQSWFTAPEYARYRQPGNVKVPFWLTPQKYYAGAAWYQREIEIPEGRRGKRVVLSLERPHWETRVWLDSRILGTNNSLATPHEYDLGQPVPGRHTVTIRVDNRMIVPIGENSHSISDHTRETGMVSWAIWSCGLRRLYGLKICRCIPISRRSRRAFMDASGTRPGAML